jgi:DNA polymerase-3 subunit delta'
VACQKVENGGHPDLLWVDFARQAALLKETVDKQKSIKIGTVREMEHALRLKPLEGRVKVAILTPADALGDDAAHALLKIVEEPPPGTHIVLIYSLWVIR